MSLSPTVLFSTPVLLHPPLGGPYLRIENSIKALSQVSRLYLFSRLPTDAVGGTEAMEYYKGYCKGVYLSPSAIKARIHRRLMRRVVNLIRRKIAGRDVFLTHASIGSPSVDDDGRSLLKTAASIKADIIWLGYGNISYPLLRYIKKYSRYNVVVDTDSVWSQFILRGAPFAKDEAHRREIEQIGGEKREEEIWGTQLADVTTAVSEVDADYYRKLAQKQEQVHLFANAVDPSRYEVVPPMPLGFRKPCIYLAGTFGPRSPMEDAAWWVIDKILPLVRKRIPNLHFYVVGMGSDTTLDDTKCEHMTVTGPMKSVLPYLCHADVVVVPLRYESGTRFKILEAGICGVPVVSTTLGAEGLAVHDKSHLLLADDPATFAQAIITLLENPELSRGLAANLRKTVLENYSIGTLMRQAMTIFDYLAVSQA